MNYLKIMGLAAIAAAALMAFAGTASATILTGKGGAELGPGTQIVAANEGTITFDPPFGKIECKESELAGKTALPIGEDVVVNIETMKFGACNAVVTVLTKGSLSIEGTGFNDGILRGSGQEVTIELLNTHCIYRTNNTALGTITGSSTTGSTATWDVSATLSRTGGRSGAFCGSTAPWTGAYKITEPDTLNIDK